MGLLAAFGIGFASIMIVGLGRIDARLDAMNARLDTMNTRLDEQNRVMSTRLDEQNKVINSLVREMADFRNHRHAPDGMPVYAGHAVVE